MNRSWIVLAKIEDLTEISPLNRIIYAESNSPNNKPRLNGEEVREFIAQILKMLPNNWTKSEIKGLLELAIKEVI